MKVLVLSEDLYDYLKHVVRSHAEGGIAPEEGKMIFDLWGTVTHAQTVDPKKLAEPSKDSEPTNPKPEEDAIPDCS